ncbi:excinuclease ABC subunit UvrB [Patescibacteria group bacterium]
MKLKLKAPYKPTPDQAQAIAKLESGIRAGLEHQVLLGVTGSGKTFTIANLIKKIQKPTLVISHNKTLAAQLYQEFRDFFPENAVSYFVSYYDYYQPEAYLPHSDTYIEKETDVNEEIEKLRLKATSNLVSRKDVIVIASVSCLYNLGSPKEYSFSSLSLSLGGKWSRDEFLKRVVKLFYRRSEFELIRGTFRVRGDFLDLYPAYEDEALRVFFDQERIVKMAKINPLTGREEKLLKEKVLYPAKHYLPAQTDQKKIFSQINHDLADQVKFLKKSGKDLEAHRLKTKVSYDLEQIQEFGYVNGIENYSRYFDRRRPGQPPFALLDYFPKDYLTVIDESHMTIPQIRGMFAGDQARKKVLIDYGFRLPAALDNRPLQLGEFLKRTHQLVYTSATPALWELGRARQTSPNHRFQKHPGVIEQLIRPTGIPDPKILIHPCKNQVEDLLSQIKKRVKSKQRVLVTTLTKRMAEDLTTYLKERDFKVAYLHSEVNTLDRSDILDDLRLGKYDVVVGINLLREGLDLPEVSLVAILDADKEGFLRSETALIQTMGRAARHAQGEVIMYADKITGSMARAIKETKRRRQIQLEYNQEHGLIPITITKPIREKLLKREKKAKKNILQKRRLYKELDALNPNQLLPGEIKKLVINLRGQMRQAAANLEFELAAEIRDKIKEISTKSFG